MTKNYFQILLPDPTAQEKNKNNNLIVEQNKKSAPRYVISGSQLTIRRNHI